MSSLDFDLDSQMCHLESEWRQAYENSIALRAEVLALSEAPKRNTVALAKAHARLERAEGTKASIMAKIERLEENLLGNT
jgi:hypothetical protein